MSLPENIYKMFESVVGPENISGRPHILAAYRHASPQDGRKPASPDAVVLPGSAEEVQAIVRICRDTISSTIHYVSPFRRNAARRSDENHSQPEADEQNFGDK